MKGVYSASLNIRIRSAGSSAVRNRQPLLVATFTTDTLAPISFRVFSVFRGHNLQLTVTREFGQSVSSRRVHQAANVAPGEQSSEHRVARFAVVFANQLRHMVGSHGAVKTDLAESPH